MLDRIQSQLETLTPAEARVAQLLLRDPQTFMETAVETLAQQAGVSKPTVVRMSRSLGFSGLIDLKLKLAGSLNVGVPFIHSYVEASDDVGQIIAKVLDNTAGALIQFRDQANSNAIAEAVTAIDAVHREQGRLALWGVGNSGIVAEDAQLKFFRLGFHAMTSSDGHLQIMSASLLGPKDCALVISNSGQTRDLQDACEIARTNGARVIVITASHSPLAALADIHLAADHPESYEQFSPMLSRLLHLVILDILATAVALRIGADQLAPQLKLMKHNLTKKRYRA
jgi:RpiR family transcriptional regulator, carbohydrate utilization regulator